MITPVIMAGGSGSRLWPLSRSLYPKQFLALNGNETMLQQTLQRLSGLTLERPVVICNEEHRFIVAEQLREINQSGSIILEPVGRNTAPAIALASKTVMASKDSLILILAADHVIENESAFVDAVEKAIPLAEAGKLVTFGIVPTEAHTGYGYIKRGESVNEHGFQVDAFVEKPNAEIASEYFEGKEHYWNSGMFLMKASRYLEELKQFRPDIYTACESALANTSKDEDFIRIDKGAFEKCPDESIDYAVMEKTADAVVVPLDAGWSDIGSWSALWDVNNKDSNGNAVVGDSIIHETTNCLIQGSERLIATVGIDNLVIVDTKDALLVASKDRVQDVKRIVEQLKAEGRSEFKNHREVYRPWGKYDSIDTGTRYQVKRITVKPGEKLSIQMHHHRAEHWIVVSGTAKVTNGDKTFLVTENESTYIPIGVIHALENPGKLPLEMIEVQSGTYLGEDDIVRFEDRYGRV
ncbi:MULTISPECIES: mannose-1-phosphate guanylyltransferase/mannose-6-phosphate isomerase [unclassified Colwellia]|uniref:mannose-1-phosphate guanylyltransferase/mannose-6-phosphate isomerase n=1 Tax=unclassified Colwellia TaxID=196834 RepID=UPI0015F62396|nr:MULTISPECIES: mannose-1-phosphate guanylyltransferase/mannose-6-phosphate isomerase [unclassified Colwellia]MBA6357993.1 mannose-1-phosphate guanylyltransferase/mannose-6-phosphate isomerase [Colwellia sp. BRX8-3]MBA6361840.1 mannose-1-phosphate guanylyltransferase/mannose-6-phosphate isomerase [Colwellia sp. BRX8-6]MBA6369673.1 mannose-1-phosphate guanylyltransferase/mannose-6-phosphate isomerase [Colwellia sp. BRX8-5]MBA6376990.1 mannose-1-phosphate guanylyltransferase/mannose-6-phosphate 